MATASPTPAATPPALADITARVLTLCADIDRATTALAAAVAPLQADDALDAALSPTEAALATPLAQHVAAGVDALRQATRRLQRGAEGCRQLLDSVSRLPSR